MTLLRQDESLLEVIQNRLKQRFVGVQPSVISTSGLDDPGHIRYGHPCVYAEMNALISKKL